MATINAVNALLDIVGDSENEKPLTALFITPVSQCIVLVWLHFPLDKVITSFHWRSVAGKAAQDGYETSEQVWKGYNHHH